MAPEAAALLDAYLREALAARDRWSVRPRNVAAGKAILDADGPTQCAIALLAADGTTVGHAYGDRQRALHNAFTDLMRRRLPWTEAQLCQLLDLLSSRDPIWLDAGSTVAAVARHVGEGDLQPGLREALQRVAQRFRARHQSGVDLQRALAVIAELLSEQPGLAIDVRDRWAADAARQIEALPAGTREAWRRLLQHAGSSQSTRPSAKWLKEARTRLTAVGTAFTVQVLDWFAAFDEPSERERMPVQPNLDVLRGCVWMAGLEPDANVQRALVGLTTASMRMAGISARAPRVANACICVLGQIGTRDAVGHLAVLATRFKKGSVRKEIEKALRRAAEALGMTRDELDELAVPTFGLSSVGAGEFAFGAATARLVLPVSGGAPELHWRNEQDKPVKSPPASVKSAFAAELKELKARQKDLARLATAQQARLDGLYLQRRRLPLGDFRERYLDHPVVGALARRLIWSFAEAGASVAALPRGDTLLRVDGRSWQPGPSAEVTLWHPIQDGVADVLRWRELLLGENVVQPFKQAHREVYLLTDAERRTEVYSNRFAAHIIKQHQFAALAAARGWQHKLRLMVDDFAPPTHRELPAFGLRAEYWVEGIGAEHGSDTTEAGAFRHVATDQVRFYAIGSEMAHAHASGGSFMVAEGVEPLRLDDVPALAFTEVMRDVDLFVGVASVANDPQWADHGRDQPQRDYWHRHAFGELSASAEIRRQVLQGLIPRLAIAERCTFEERYLVVRGDLCSYKIHLGSGNILMEPGDRYLCIVGDGSATKAAGTIHLPFEGDRTLSLILSKALLLAADRKITDPTITRQIAAG